MRLNELVPLDGVEQRLQGLKEPRLPNRRGGRFRSSRSPRRRSADVREGGQKPGTDGNTVKEEAYPMEELLDGEMEGHHRLGTNEGV